VPGGGELLAIGDVVAIDVVTQTQPVFAIRNVAETYLA
jgi:hypothetical protein